MEDKTPIYLMSIVGIVALVAVVYMMSGTGGNDVKASGDAITGNVVDDIEPVNYSGLGRFMVAAGLIGACIFLYKKVD